MKNVIKNIKNSKGFVSIESILVIGAVVILAGLIIFFFNTKATDISESSGSNITSGDTKVTEGTTASESFLTK